MENEKSGFGGAPRYSVNSGFYDMSFESERTREKKLLRKTANSIGGMVLAYLLLSNIGAKIVTLFIDLLPPFSFFRTNIYAAEVLSEIIDSSHYLFSLLPPLFIYIAIVGIPAKVALPFRSPKSDMALGGIVIGLGMISVASYSTGWFYNALRVFGIEATQPEFALPETLPGRIAYFISVAIIPAFVEEMLMRGAIMQSLRRFGDTFALIVSSIMFGMLHMNFIQMPYAFIMGMCIGYFVLRSGSIWVGIVIHLINNGVTMLMDFFAEDMMLGLSTVIDMTTDVLFMFIGLLALIFLSKRHKDLFSLESFSGALEVPERVKTFALSPVFAITFVVMLIKSVKYLAFL